MHIPTHVLQIIVEKSKNTGLGESGNSIIQYSQCVSVLQC